MKSQINEFTLVTIWTEWNAPGFILWFLNDWFLFTLFCICQKLSITFLGKVLCSWRFILKHFLFFFENKWQTWIDPSCSFDGRWSMLNSRELNYSIIQLNRVDHMLPISYGPYVELVLGSQIGISQIGYISFISQLYHHLASIITVGQTFDVKLP